MVPSKDLFFSTDAASTIDALGASPKDRLIMIVSNGRSLRKRHFRPFSSKKVVKFDSSAPSSKRYQVKA